MEEVRLCRPFITVCAYFPADPDKKAEPLRHRSQSVAARHPDRPSGISTYVQLFRRSGAVRPVILMRPMRLIMMITGRSFLHSLVIISKPRRPADRSDRGMP